MFKSSTFIFLIVLSVANCQFYYNYEDDKPQEPEMQDYDPSAYQYNPPSSVNRQFAQTNRNNAEPSTETGQRRTHIRVRSRNYNSARENSEAQQLEYDPTPEPKNDQRAARQQRRQARRQQRQRDYIEPISPPRTYAPSVFENIGLGEAPRGIYIPQNSFLNVLRNPSPSLPVSPPIATVPQTTNYVQPAVSYVNTRPIQGLFLQPPTNEEPRQTNLILPVTRSQMDYPVPSLRQPISGNQQTGSQNVQSRAVGTNRYMRQKVRLQAEYAAPPTVDIDSFREYTDDIGRENVMSKVQYVRPEIKTQNRRRTVTSIQETPRVYSPSIFEKVTLGEAPSGIYIPEDSLLNVLRNPSGRQIANTASRQESRQLPPQQQSYNIPEEHVEEIIEEEQYQPPIPPPPPSRRRSSQRSRQTLPSRRSENPPRNQNMQQDQSSVQPVQSSSRNQRNDVYEDFERQRAPVQHQTQSQRRPSPISTAASRPQTQTSTSDRGQTAFKKANLAIAELPLDTDEDGIPGEAGVNYPTLHVIPKTAFSCSKQSHNGYYADLETSCQVVHLCQSGGVQNSFLCPNGTIFSQEKFSCQWWYKVNCSDAPKFYIKNDELYKVPEKKERKRN